MMSFSLQTALNNLDPAIFIMIFFSYAVTDGLYAWYTLKVTEKKAFEAVTIGSFMHILIAFGVINYSQNWLYIIPIVCGSWLGTYLFLKINQNTKKFRLKAECSK